MGFVASNRRKRTYPTGADCSWWKGGPVTKTCEFCGESFVAKPATAKVQKFCSRACGWKGQKYLRGTANGNYRPDARRRSRQSRQHAWSTAVISRDQRCLHCGSDVNLHAHHVKSYRDHPELRWDVSNGETLCATCHWNEHSALNANGVNSGNRPPANAEANPEPSDGRKPVEGVTTRGRAYRRYVGECGWCHAPISKRWSDTKGKAKLFCSRSHASKWRVKERGALKRKPTAVIASTSAPAERHDIV